MGKWVAAAGLALLVVLFVLWRQLDAADATAAPPPPAQGERVVHASAPAVTASAVAPAATEPASAEPAAEEPSDQPQKIDVESDEFFYKFQEVVPAVLTRNAAKCYEGIAKRVHRNQKLVLKFKTRIKDGVVTVHDVTVDVNTLDNAGLESCFIQEVARSTWTDPSLPDWEAEDELVLRPERGMKKYMRENIEYVGAEAPRD